MANSVALATAEEPLRRFYARYGTGQPRLFIDLLHYQRWAQLPWEHIDAAVDRLAHRSPRSLSLELIQVLCQGAESSPVPASQAAEEYINAILGKIG